MKKIYIVNHQKEEQKKPLTFQDYVRLIQEFLQKYKLNYQDIKPSYWYKKQDLYGFIRRIRHNYEDGTLSKEKEQIMRSLGESFSYPYVKTEKIYQILSSYLKETKKEYQRIEENTFYEGYELSHLIKSIKRRKLKNSLTLEETNLFLDLGEQFLCMDLFQLASLIEEYLTEKNLSYQDIPTSANIQGYSLYPSIERAQKMYWSQGLKEEEEQALRQVGETFIKSISSYEQGISLLKECLEEEQISIKKITGPFIYKKYALGKFLDNARENYHQGKLSSRHSKSLLKLGETFSNVRPGYYSFVSSLVEYSKTTDTPMDQIPDGASYNGRNIGKSLRKYGNLYITDNLTQEEELPLCCLNVDLTSRLTTINALQKYYRKLAIRLYERKGKIISNKETQTQIEEQFKRILK